jgi:hypothetical protein
MPVLVPETAVVGRILRQCGSPAAAAGIDVVLKCVQCVRRVIFRVRPGHDRAIRL